MEQHSLGRALARLRERAGLTQEQAAAKIGASRPAVVRWETQKPWGLRPRPHNLTALLNLYGATDAERAEVFTLFATPAVAA